jgi:endonuclease YncB( thermonuclease family)
MKKIMLLIIFLCWPLTAHGWMAKVVSVTDGDTIKVYNTEYGQVKIRFYGIDTPEKGQPYGQAAGKYLAALIAGKMVEIESVDRDRYGRTVGIVNYNGIGINEQMVRDGFAWVYRRYCDRSFCNEWLKNEAEARDSKIGLWQEPNAVAPWDWRRKK